MDLVAHAALVAEVKIYPELELLEGQYPLDYLDSPAARLAKRISAIVVGVCGSKKTPFGQGHRKIRQYAT